MVKAAPMQAYLPSVLIVDDEPSICDVVADACRQCGLSPLTATSATSAMEILDHQAVDVMVCDLIMADMDGVRLMERCVNRPQAPKMLVMTGYGSLDTAQQAMRLGALDYVLKPFDVQDLARRIRNAAVAGVQSHAAADVPRGDESRHVELPRLVDPETPPGPVLAELVSSDLYSPIGDNYWVLRRASGRG